MVGVLGDLGGRVVADVGVEGGDEHQGLVEVLVDLVPVGLEAVDTVDGEGVAGVAE